MGFIPFDNGGRPGDTDNITGDILLFRKMEVAPLIGFIGLPIDIVNHFPVDGGTGRVVL